MIEILENHYNSLETKRADLFEILNRYTANELNTSVVQGKWSPLQIVEHLSKAEHLSVIYVSKKYNAIDELKPSGISEDLKILSLKWYLNSSHKMKAPKITRASEGDLDISILDEWAENRAKLVQLLDMFDETTYKRKVFKHAFAGRVNIMHMLQFFEAHFDHHKKQILERLPSR